MKTFTIEEMENCFEIGRAMQAMFDNGQIEIEDSKEAFMLALQMSVVFEKACPDSEDYYSDLYYFMTETILSKFGK